ncbi:MAG: hypothetical protein EOP47_19235 [Sphingobacteriaceae bacterium]|nr:MAG: hypothetical protein EOP47_19235 [Sphingobacteriaceae bacterium]
MIQIDGLVPCLVKDTTVNYCKHNDCKYLNEYPINYFERRSEKIRRRWDFTYFEIHTSQSGTRWIMPVNPYHESMPENNSFELFRQGYGEIKIMGRVPNYRNKFHRDEIAFKYIALLKDSWMFSENASAMELTEYEDIEEVAYFTGPV